MRRLLYGVALLTLLACKQEIGTGGGGDDSRPSIIAACSEGLKSDPQPVHRPSPTSPTPNIVVNIPRPDPTVNCNRTDARTGLAE